VTDLTPEDSGMPAPARTRFAPVPEPVAENPRPEPAEDTRPEPAEDPRPEPAGSPVPEVALVPVTDVPSVEGRRQGRLLVQVLAALVVLLALLTGYLGYTVVQTRGPAPVEGSRKAALDAGRAAARLVFSYDYRHLDKDFSAGRATTTGKFRAEYDKTTKRLVEDVAPRYKAVVVADVSEASVVSASGSRAVLLVFVNQQSSSSLAASPKITQSRLEMTMQRVGGRWLVADIKAL
jgi:Mce-associated membrane protein